MLAEPGALNETKVMHDYVPGALHTNNRAEIFAVLAPVLLGDGGVIYSDSDIAAAGISGSRGGTATLISGLPFPKHL